MFTLKQDLGCPRRMTVYAIFDILDRLKSSYDQVMTGDIQAPGFRIWQRMSLCLCSYGKLSGYLNSPHHSPAADFRHDKEDEQLVLLYLMEHILLHINEVLVH